MRGLIPSLFPPFHQLLKVKEFGFQKAPQYKRYSTSTICPNFWTINHISLVFLTFEPPVLTGPSSLPASLWVSQTRAASWNLLLDVQISHPLRLWLPPERKLLLEHRFKGPAGDIQQLHHLPGITVSETRHKICCRKNLIQWRYHRCEATKNTSTEINGTFSRNYWTFKNPERLRNLNSELRGQCLVRQPLTNCQVDDHLVQLIFHLL